MVQSVEVLLDAASDRWIRDQWASLDQAGLPSMVMHGTLENWPHLTLAVADRVPVDAEAGLRMALAGLPISVRLGGVLWFPGRRHAVARAVVPSPELIAIQQQVHGCLAGTDLRRRVVPGEWMPHVTLARGVHPDQLTAVLACLAAFDGVGAEPVARLHTARLWNSESRSTRVL